MTLWDYKSRTWARKAWQAWYDSATLSAGAGEASGAHKRHLLVTERVTNARAESINGACRS